MTTPFPILRLSYLALEHTIQLMTVGAQLKFSKLSKRSRWIVRNSTSRQEIHLRLRIEDDAEVYIKNTTTRKSCAFPLRPRVGQKVPSITRIKVLLLQMSWIFKKIRVRLVFFDKKTHFWLIRFVKKLQNVTLGQVMVVSNEANDKLSMLSFKACKDITDFAASCRTTRRFKPKFDAPFGFQSFYVHFAQWLTVDHLTNFFMNCNDIEIVSGKFTVDGFNTFFKTWIAGCNIKKFTYAPDTFFDEAQEDYSLPKLLDGIPCTSVRQAFVDSELVEFKENECFLIQSSGEVDAIVYQGLRLRLRTEFSLNSKEMRLKTDNL